MQRETGTLACQMAPVALCKHSRRPGPHGAHPCCNLPRQSFGMDLQMGRELDVNFLFVPAPGSCSVDAVRSLKNGFSASQEQTQSRASGLQEVAKTYAHLPGTGVAGLRRYCWSNSPRTFTTTRVATSRLGAMLPADCHPLTYAF